MGFGGSSHGSRMNCDGRRSGPLRFGLSDKRLELALDPAEDPLLLQDERSDDRALPVEIGARPCCAILGSAELLSCCTLIRGRRFECVDKVGLVTGNHRLVGLALAEVGTSTVQHDLERFVGTPGVSRHGVTAQVVASPGHFTPGDGHLTLVDADPLSELGQRQLSLIEGLSEH